MISERETTIRNFIKFMEKNRYKLVADGSGAVELTGIGQGDLDSYLNNFLKNPTNLSEDIYALKERIYSTEVWLPEGFYFAIKNIPYELEEDKEYPAFILLTKWEWEEKSSYLAEQGYHDIHQMFKKNDDMNKNQFDWADGVFWVKNMTEEEIKEELTKMGMEEKQEILEAFPYL